LIAATQTDFGITIANQSSIAGTQADCGRAVTIHILTTDFTLTIANHTLIAGTQTDFGLMIAIHTLIAGTQTAFGITMIANQSSIAATQADCGLAVTIRSLAVTKSRARGADYCTTTRPRSLQAFSPCPRVIPTTRHLYSHAADAKKIAFSLKYTKDKILELIKNVSLFLN